MMGDDSPAVEVMVTMDDDHDIDALSRRLSDKGLENAVGLAAIGVISGTVAPGRIAQLRAEPGVKAVEVAGQMGIAPPDADIQ
jgi:uncharacterized cupin superfamily protein